MLLNIAIAAIIATTIVLPLAVIYEKAKLLMPYRGAAAATTKRRSVRAA